MPNLVGSTTWIELAPDGALSSRPLSRGAGEGEHSITLRLASNCVRGARPRSILAERGDSGSASSYRKSPIATPCMSANTWFSPPMAQQKEYAAVPQPEWMDQPGDSATSSSRTTRWRV